MSRWKLYYTAPATRWEEALPIGNGWLGGMVFGGTHRERIQLNEDTLWTGRPKETIRAQVRRQLPAVREAIFAGRYEEAEQRIESTMLGRDTESYQPLGDLHILHLDGGEEDFCTRELDLDTAVVTTRYGSSRGSFIREAFISEPDQVLAVRLRSAGTKAPVSVTVCVDSPQEHVVTVASGNTLVLTGTCPGGEEALPGLSFCIHVQAAVPNGRVDAEDGGRLKIDAFEEVVLYLAAATNFERFDICPEESRVDPAAQTRQQLASARRLGFKRLLQRHAASHQALFQRVALDLGGGASEAFALDERLRRYQQGCPDTHLEALFFQYGRYLLIASSRLGTQPAHLQGIWNDQVTPLGTRIIRPISMCK